MIEINCWLEVFLDALDEIFGARVVFVGLQGSYRRGEATDKSDIDLVVILDELSFEDIEKYNAMLDTLPNRELICGFISGKRELLAWEPSDLFQLYYDTMPIKGSLDELKPLIDEAAVNRAIKNGACSIYHTCVHNMLYDKWDGILSAAYKSAYYTIQAIGFKNTGKFADSADSLISLVSEEDAEIVKTYMHLKKGGEVDFAEMSEKLFKWAQKTIG
ncbi:MAG: nucleotidyltransferase domain-containing protein [Clostridia bacterium]|nr:nucleotidyltransferase domain-containing protein [Clostridia bacterium]